MKHLLFLGFIGNLKPARFGNRARSVFVCFTLLFGRAAYSNDFFWVADPVDNNWFNPANWSSGAVPGPFDAAHFGVSTITNIELTQTGDAIDLILFDTGADSFTITALPDVTFEIVHRCHH